MYPIQYIITHNAGAGLYDHTVLHTNAIRKGAEKRCDGNAHEKELLVLIRDKKIKLKTKI